STHESNSLFTPLYSKFFTIASVSVSYPPQLLASASLVERASSESLAAGSVASDTMVKAAGESSLQAVSAIPSISTQAISFFPTLEVFVLVFCLVVFGISMGMWIKQTY
ncbi:MAG: hypothetical protein AABY11_01535, partial [archaeon]